MPVGRGLVPPPGPPADHLQAFGADAAGALQTRQGIAGNSVVEARKCGKWLSDFLMDGPKPSCEVFKAAITTGYSRDQVKDAKQRIGAVARKRGYRAGAQWTWQLPARASR